MEYKLRRQLSFRQCLHRHSQCWRLFRYVSSRRSCPTCQLDFVTDTTNDGVLGLAFDSLNSVTPIRQKTFFSNAIAQRLPEPIFTANLKKGTPGNYNFGYIDDAEYTGKITYLPINTANGFWQFTSNGYAIGSGAFISDSIDTIADTSTPLTYLLFSEGNCLA